MKLTMVKLNKMEENLSYKLNKLIMKVITINSKVYLHVDE